MEMLLSLMSCFSKKLEWVNLFFFSSKSYFYQKDRWEIYTQGEREKGRESTLSPTDSLLKMAAIARIIPD